MNINQLLICVKTGYQCFFQGFGFFAARQILFKITYNLKLSSKKLIHNEQKRIPDLGKNAVENVY